MARPIRNTPILTGYDATAFVRAAESKPSSRACAAERSRLEASVAKFQMMLTQLPK